MLKSVKKQADKRKKPLFVFLESLLISCGIKHNNFLLVDSVEKSVLTSKNFVEKWFRYFRGCLGVDLSTREGYSVKKTVWHTVFSCKSVAPAKPGRMRGNAEAAVPPYNNMRLASKVGCESRRS